MTLISIRERGLSTPDPVVSIDGQEYPITVADPFSPAEEARLEWYFEEHLRFPFLDNVQAQAAAASVRTYGVALFQGIFSGAAYGPYYAARPTRGGGDHLRDCGGAGVARAPLGGAVGPGVG